MRQKARISTVGAALLRGAAVLVMSAVAGGAFLYGQSASEQRPDETGGERSIESAGNRSVTVYFFWGDGCPYCEQEAAFLEELQSRMPEVEVESFEVWHHPENVPILREMARAHDIRPRAVPLTFIGESHWVGFKPSIAAEMEAAIQECLSRGCSVPAQP
jgi:thiol-disulfide isomerase/thioredoxin